MILGTTAKEVAMTTVWEANAVQMQRLTAKQDSPYELRWHVLVAAQETHLA